MVNLTRIYTRTGDAGRTRLSDMSETAKTDQRVEAYGHVDEANSLIGMVTTQPDLPAEVGEVLRHIQNELFDCGADLSNPLAENPAYEPLRVIQPYVDRLEGWCDQFGEPLPSLRSFILPGGTQTAAMLHLARTVVRRAERAGWRAVEIYGNEPGLGDEPGGVNLLALTYLNRLSDLLFILARSVGQASGEVLWVPGGDREIAEPLAALRRRRITGSVPPAEPTPAS